jgi:phosphate starvation-inducible PhoH-like protein
MLMNKHTISDIIYIRSVIESASKSLGYLPGEAEDKMQPYLQPLMDKVEEILPSGEANQLLKEKRIIGSAVNFLRGASWNAKFIIADEAQNFDFKELTTILTRLGKFSKLIIAGDPMQSDINGKSGFVKMSDLFNNEASKENGIHYFSFTKEDIVRSGILKFIVERIESANVKNVTPEPMFPLK